MHPQHPLKEFFWMLAAVGIALTVAIALLIALANYLVTFVPFEMEQRLAQQMEVNYFQPGDAPPTPALIYLQSLGHSLAQAQQAPHPIRIHLLDSDDINAFATLGGHIFISRGLLEVMPNENALAMVLAHEIAHISHRDPIIATGRGLTVALAIMSLTGVGDGAMAHQLASQFSLVTQLSFSRSAEAAADLRALETLRQYYGHTLGADALFNYLVAEQGRGNALAEQPLLALLNSHPLHADRIATINAFTGNDHNGQGQLTPLPANWLATRTD